MLEAFFAAENQRDWERYVEFLHPDVEWVIDGRAVQGRGDHLDAIAAAYAGSDAQFRLHRIIESSDHNRVATLLVDSEENRSLDVFEFEDGLIRREWEFLLGPGGDWNGDVVEFRFNV